MQCIRRPEYRHLARKGAVCHFPACIHPASTPRRLHSHAGCGGRRHRPYYSVVERSPQSSGCQVPSIGPCSHYSILSETNSTIYALSTAPGRSAIAIVRCSGPLCLDIYKALCPETHLPKPRYASVRSLLAPASALNGGQLLDSEALVLFFPAPQTVTGEDVLELHIHGGNAIIKAVLAAIPAAVPHKKGFLAPIRYAEPGEFTKRAFYHDRLDLTQVEALGDTLSAETEQQRCLAVRGMSNALRERYEAWRKLLLAARGELEALIDFSEDQHFDDSPSEFVKSVSSQVTQLQSQIFTSLRNAAKGELLRNGIKIALLGAPNAGKSSLLNQIVGREAAIVSSEAGTTRDVVDVNVDIGGFFCRFSDLAGIRASSARSTEAGIGNIEKEGIRRAKMNALAADVVVVVTSFEQDAAPGKGWTASLDPEIADFLRNQIRPQQKVLHVLSKADLPGQANFTSSNSVVQGFSGLVPCAESRFPVSCLIAETESVTSAVRESGMQNFLDGLIHELKALTTAESITISEVESVSEMFMGSNSFDQSLGSSERQRRLLEQCNSHLGQFLVDVRGSSGSTTDLDNHTTENDSEEADIVLAAERLRAAAECLAKITGRGEGGDVEEVLGVVFEKFCVGK